MWQGLAQPTYDRFLTCLLEQTRVYPADLVLQFEPLNERRDHQSTTDMNVAANAAENAVAM